MYRRDGIALVLVFILFAVLDARSEPAAEKGKQCESTLKFKLPNTSLLGRSEMQEPKPLPVIRLLRLQEIPVSVCAQDSRETLGDVRNSSVGIGTQEQRPQPVAPGAPGPGVKMRDVP